MVTGHRFTCACLASRPTCLLRRNHMHDLLYSSLLSLSSWMHTKFGPFSFRRYLFIYLTGRPPSADSTSANLSLLLFSLTPILNLHSCGIIRRGILLFVLCQSRSRTAAATGLSREDGVRCLRASPHRLSRSPNRIRRLARLRTIRIILAPWTTITIITSTMA
ncbi:hypothetical protein CPC08DRAFT_338112 [Agrocybe pediades]|nr:hypothetical protein CPC08DRAFT_338112 [Agrocybe pediades]